MQRIACFAVLTASLLSDSTVTAQEKPLVAPKPLAYWVGRLTHPNPAVRYHAAEVVTRDVESFLPGAFFFNSDWFQQRATFRDEAKPLLPQLIEVLRSSNSQLELDGELVTPLAAACAVIQLLGTYAESALPELKRLVCDKNATNWSRYNCCFAILAATPENQPVGPLFIELLNSTSIEMPAVDAEQFDSAYIAATLPMFYGALMATGHTKSEVPYLVQVAEGDCAPVIRATAVGILGQLDFDATSAIPALRRLLKDKEQLVRVWAADSLLSIEKDNKRIPEIANALDLNREERTELETGFKEMVSRQKAERERWRETTGDNDFDKELLKVMVGTMVHGSGFDRRKVIQIAGYIGPAAKDVIPQLRKALNDPDEDTRRMAREALQRIQP